MPINGALFSYGLGFCNKDTLKVLPIDDYWYGGTCSIFFLSTHSKFAHIHKLSTGVKFRNWTIIGVESLNLEKSFGSNRRAAKVLQVAASPIDVIKTHIEPYNDAVLAIVRHPFSSTFWDEFRAIHRTYHVYKNTAVTDNFNALLKQVETYNSSALMKLDFVQTMVEGGYQVIKVHDEVGKQFRCSWLNEVQKYADRDQVSFPYVLGWMTYGNKPQPGAHNSSFLYFRDEAEGGGGLRRIQLLNSSVYWWKTEGTRLAKLLNYQELMQFK
eukprot:gene28055-33873_t